MTPSRQKAKPVFDPAALAEDLDELWPAPNSRVQAPEPAPRPTAPVAERPIPPAASEPSRGSTPAPQAASGPARPAPATVAQPVTPVTGDHGEPRRRLASVMATESPAKKRARPPEVLLSAEVYDELYRVQIAEKKIRRGLARTMGAIVLDAIEAHASRLATTWSTPQFAVGEGQIFERLSSNAVPRRRRHATAPRTVVLSGVTAANGQRLDDLVHAWDAGTRSALVEQALRYEFGLLPEG